MGKSIAERIEALSLEDRYRVLERAGIIFDTGDVTWEEADSVAFAQEMTKPGLASAGALAAEKPASVRRRG